MKLRTVGEAEVELLEADSGEIVLDPGFGAVELLAASLALCTASVLRIHAKNVVKIPVTGLCVRVRWQELERPARVAAFELDIVWPELPASRFESVKRAARTCTIHRTLEHAPGVSTSVSALLRQ